MARPPRASFQLVAAVGVCVRPRVGAHAARGYASRCSARRLFVPRLGVRRVPSLTGRGCHPRRVAPTSGGTRRLSTHGEDESDDVASHRAGEGRLVRNTRLDANHKDVLVAALSHAHKQRQCGNKRKPGQPLMVFTSGVPGAGKTVSLHRAYGLDELDILDLDKEMEHHPLFDRENRAAVYEDPCAYDWANDRVEKKFQSLLEAEMERRRLLALGCSPQEAAALAAASAGYGNGFVEGLDGSTRRRVVAVDGTGTKLDRRIRRMRQARDAGFWVQLFYVRVKLETALRRNLARERVVPRQTMELYFSILESSVRRSFPHADEVLVVDNDKDDELQSWQRWGEEQGGQGVAAIAADLTTKRHHSMHPTAY